jgi:hypothetical protein
MEKAFIDELYHQLRELCVTDDIPAKEAISGLVSHLTRSDGDYPGLLKFLDYYGTLYVLPYVMVALKSTPTLLSASRVVEFGAGTGWLGRGIALRLGGKPTLFVDKRQYTLIDVVADLESKNGVKRVLDEMQPGDLIVMSEFLHCLEEPRKVMEQFTRWPMVVVEYMPYNHSYGKSWSLQLEKFGPSPIASIREVFPRSLISSYSTDTHGIWVVQPI